MRKGKDTESTLAFTFGAWMVSEKMRRTAEEQGCLPRQSYLFKEQIGTSAQLYWSGMARSLYNMAQYKCVR